MARRAWRTGAAGCAAAFLLGGCGSLGGSGGSATSPWTVVDFKQAPGVPTLTARPAANATAESAAALAARNYVEIGSLEVTQVIKECYAGESCQTYPVHTESASAAALREAAAKGGDLVRFDERDAVKSLKVSKQGECGQWDVRVTSRRVCGVRTTCQTMGNTLRCQPDPGACEYRDVREGVCRSFTSHSGLREAVVARGSVWRADPALASDLRFGHAMSDAVERGDLARIEALLAQGASADGRFLVRGAASHRTPEPLIYKAAEWGEREIVARLDRASTDRSAAAEATLDGACTAIRLAPLSNPATGKTPDVARLIAIANDALDRGARAKPIHVWIAQSKGSYGLAKDAFSNPARRALFLRLLGTMSNLRTGNYIDILQANLLLVALHNNDLELFRALLAAGHNTDAGNDPKYQRNPVLAVVESGRPEWVRLMIEHKANVNVCTKLSTGIFTSKTYCPLATARTLATAPGGTADSRARYQRIVEMLVAAGARDG